MPATEHSVPLINATQHYLCVFFILKSVLIVFRILSQLRLPLTHHRGSISTPEVEENNASNLIQDHALGEDCVIMF